MIAVNDGEFTTRESHGNLFWAMVECSVYSINSVFFQTGSLLKCIYIMKYIVRDYKNPKDSEDLNYFGAKFAK